MLIKFAEQFANKINKKKLQTELKTEENGWRNFEKKIAGKISKINL